MAISDGAVLGVGLIRGINVGGAARVSKQELAGAFADAGLLGAKTLLQSGNVVFEAEAEPGPEHAAAVERGLRERSGVDARVLLLGEERFRATAAANPLLEAGDDLSRLVVTFLDHELPAEAVAPADEETTPELVRLGERAVYQWCPLGVSKSVLPPAFWRSIGQVATGRNQRTVLRILAELDARG